MKRLLVILSAMLLLVSCSNASKDPVIKGYRIHQIGGLGFGLDGVTADMKLDIDIENPSSARYTVESLQATLYKKDAADRFAYVELQEPVTLDPRSDGTVSLPLGVQLLRPLALLSGGIGTDFSDYEADVDMLVRKGGLKKHIQRKRVPLDRFEFLLGGASQEQQTHEKE